MLMVPLTTKYFHDMYERRGLLKYRGRIPIRGKGKVVWSGQKRN